jgi:hypothetical protein
MLLYKKLLLMTFGTTYVVTWYGQYILEDMNLKQTAVTTKNLLAFQEGICFMGTLN